MSATEEPLDKTPESSGSRGAPSSRILEVMILLRRVIRATDLHSKHLAKTTGLTAPQTLLLQTIESNGEISIGQLAGAMKLSQATVTTILDRLEKRALVYRKRSLEDKRRVHAHLTELGRQTLRKAPIPLQAQFTRQFEALQDWEQTMIVSALSRVAQMMDAHELEATSPVLDMELLERQSSLLPPFHPVDGQQPTEEAEVE